MMEKKSEILRFVMKCILIPAAAVLVIYLINRPYKEIDAQKYLEFMKYDAVGRDYCEIHIANLGSSHGASDFIYDDIMERGFICFNFANASQTYDYDYGMLKEFGENMVKDSVLFIPVSYFSFNNEVTTASEQQAMSLRYYHFLSPENIPGYDPYVDLITNKLPILSAGEDIIKLFPDIHSALTVYAADEGIDVDEFIKRSQERYSRHFDNKSEYFLPERTEELKDIIEYCKEHDITPVLITTPFSKYYNEMVSQEFLQTFRETVTTIARDSGIHYYDYSHDERFYENLQYFSDSDHLNGEGALYFVDILWDEVEELRRFR